MGRGRISTDGARPVALRTSDGVRLAALVHPSQPNPQQGDVVGACVVVHGFTGSSRNPDVVRICRALTGHGLDVLAPDLRGHGASGGLSAAGADEVHDVAAAVAWLREQGHERVATLGWSMGGTTVLRHAGLGGDTDAVVAVSAAGTWWERGTRAMRLVHWAFESRTGRVTTRVARRTRISSGGWDPVPESPAEVAGAIAPRPLLVVHGDADRYFPMTHADALAAAAPDAEVWREAGMGHAESATGPELLGRIADWTVRALRAPRPVCDDGPRVHDGRHR